MLGWRQKRRFLRVFWPKKRLKQNKINPCAQFDRTQPQNISPKFENDRSYGFLKVMQNRSNFEVLRIFRFKLIFHSNFIGNPYFFFLTCLVMFLCNSIHSSVNKTQFYVFKSKFVTGRPTKLVSPSIQKIGKKSKKSKNIGNFQKLLKIISVYV